MSPDAPIVVTDTDDLAKMFAANINGFTYGRIGTHEADRLAASLIEIMRANCPPIDVRPVAETAEAIAELIEAEIDAWAKTTDVGTPDADAIRGLGLARQIAREYAAKEA